MTFLLVAAAGAPLLASPALGAIAGEWLPGKVIDSGTLSAIAPSVAFDGSGHAVVAWAQSDGTRFNLWASRYDVANGWGTPTMIETNDDGGVSAPQVAFDGLGTAVVVWEQSDGSRYSIWANHHSSDWGWGLWGTPELLETNDAGGAAGVQLATNHQGGLIAAWQQFDGTANSIFVNRYSAASGWIGAEAVEANDTAGVEAPQVALSPNGDAVVLWAQSGVFTDHWASVYTSGAGWGPATMIQESSGPNNDTGGYGVATLPQGKAIAVWSQANGSSKDLWSNIYAPGSGWASPQTIVSNATSPELPAIAADALGNVVAVWHQGTGVVGGLYANRYAVGSGWGTAQPIAPAYVPSTEPVRISSSPAGDAVAAWSADSAGHNSILANRYTPGIGWTPPELLERDDGYEANNPALAVDSAGNAIVAWEQSDGIAPRIWADRFAAVDIIPPTLSISSPGDGTVTNRTTIWVEGLVEPGALLSVNGVAAAVSEDGSWRLLSSLEPGPNTIIVTAVDASGNRATATAHVHFEDPTIGMAADLKEARARVAALEAQTASILLDLARAQANLTAAQARFAFVESNGNTTRLELDGARADLAAAERSVAAMEANATVARTALDAAVIDLGITRAHTEALENQSDAMQAGVDDSRAQSKAAAGQAAFATILGETGLLIAAAAAFIAFRSRQVDLQPDAPPKEPVIEPAESKPASDPLPGAAKPDVPAAP